MHSEVRPERTRAPKETASVSKWLNLPPLSSKRARPRTTHAVTAKINTNSPNKGLIKTGLLFLPCLEEILTSKNHYSDRSSVFEPQSSVLCSFLCWAFVNVWMVGHYLRFSPSDFITTAEMSSPGRCCSVRVGPGEISLKKTPSAIEVPQQWILVKTWTV